MRLIVITLSALGLTACATAAPKTGALTRYDGLQPDGGAVRAKISTRADDAALGEVRRVRLAPTRFAGQAASWMNENEQRLILREVDAQLCFEISERYEITSAETGVHTARAFVAEVAPTGQLGSAAAAAASFFVPGPIGIRAPTGRGGLAAEAELLDPQGRQVAAITWARRATVIGTDDPSLSRVGDALQFAEPFADAAAATMTAKAAAAKSAPKPDPCAQYGPRIRPEGWITKFATGLYVPQMSGAAPAQAAD